MGALILIGVFALLGWGLFCWQVYKSGVHKADAARLLAANAALVETLKQERKLATEQLELAKNLGRVDADSVNGIIDRLRKG